jgi:RNA 2',3'-cyclic 3'-phosphodiesterase
MRLFMAIPFPDDVLQAIGRAIAGLRKIRTPLRWVDPCNLHLTLRFIGEIEEQAARNWQLKLRETPLAIPPFSARIQGFGSFGRPPELSIFWAGVYDDGSLARLAATCDALLAPLAIPAENREFSPHLTLARNKSRFDFRSFLKVAEKMREEVIATWTIDRCCLYRSRLTPAGPLYSVLEELALG